MDLLNTEVSGTTNKLLQAILKELILLNKSGVKEEVTEEKQQAECCPVCGKTKEQFKSLAGFNSHVRFCTAKKEKDGDK